MRIVQISSRFPYPPDDGGRIGVWNITRQFRQLGHTVWLITFAETDTTPQRIAQLQQQVDKLTVLPPQRYSILQYLLSAVHPIPIHIRKRRTRAILEAAQRMSRQMQHWDLLHVDGTGMIPMGLRMAKAASKPVAVRMHNVEWIIWHRFANQFPRWHPARWYLLRQARLLRRWEQRLLEEVDLIVPITCPDQQRIAQEFQIRKPMVVIPAGIDPAYWSPQPRTSLKREAVLIANFEWKPNIEGVEWFVRYVLPHLPHDITFHIAGRNSDRVFPHLTRFPNVRVYGYLDDVRPLYQRATFAFVPLLSGGGIRIKILEAMAMALPVVTTSVGAEGIEAGEEEGIFRKDDPRDFAAQIQYLADHLETAVSLGARARHLVLQRYTWEALIARLLRAYEQLLRSPAENTDVGDGERAEHRPKE